MKNFIKGTIASLGFIALVLVAGAGVSYAALTISKGNTGGTGYATTTSTNVGKCLEVSSSSPIGYTFGDCNFATTSANYWNSTFTRWSTTSTAFYLSQNNQFSTTSANYWETTQASRSGASFSTTSADYYLQHATVPVNTSGTATSTFAGPIVNGNGHTLGRGATFLVATSSKDGDYTDLAKAVAALPSGGGTVIMGCGQFNLPVAGLPISQSNISIIGQGECSQVNFNASTTPVAIYNSNSAVQLSHLIFRDFLVSSQAPSPGGGLGIDFTNFTLSTFQNVNFTRLNQGMVASTTGSHYNTIINSKANVSGDGSFGFKVWNLAIDNTFINTRVISDSHTIGYYFDAHHVVCVNCDTETNALIGMYLGADANDSDLNVYQEGNHTNIEIATGVEGTNISGFIADADTNAQNIQNDGAAGVSINARVQYVPIKAYLTGAGANFGGTAIGTTTNANLLTLEATSSNPAFNNLYLYNPNPTANSPTGILGGNQNGNINVWRIFGNPGSGFTNPDFHIDVANSAKVLQSRLTINTNGDLLLNDYFSTSTATSTMAGGLRITGSVSAKLPIEAPSYIATSTTATSTFSGGASVSGGLAITTLKSCSSTNALTTDSSGNVICGPITGSSSGASFSTTSAAYWFQGQTGNLSIGALTSTSTATSTLAGGINVTGGCLAVGGNCILSSSSTTTRATDATYFVQNLGTAYTAYSQSTGFFVSNASFDTVMTAVLSNAASASTTIALGSGVFTTTNGIDLNRGNISVTGQGEGVTTIAAASTTALDSKAFFQIDPAQTGLPSSLVIDAPVGTSTIVISPAGAAGFAPGDYFNLYSSRSIDSEFTNRNQGEIHKIIAVNYVTGAITIGQTNNGTHIYQTFLTADTSRIVKLNMYENINISGITFTDTAGFRPSTLATGQVFFRFVRNLTVANSQFKNEFNSGLALWSDQYVNVTNNDFRDMKDVTPNSNTFYGVNVRGAMLNVNIVGNTFQNMRHGVTSDAGSTTFYSGTVRDFNVVANSFVGTFTAHIDTHQGVEGCTITGNTMVGDDGGANGIQVRTPCTVTSNSIVAVKGFGIHLFGQASGSTVANNDIRGALDCVFVEYGVHDVLINGNTCINGQKGIALSSYSDPITISIATPAVVTYSANNLSVGTALTFSTTGALPTGITAGTVYYSIATSASKTSFEIAATPTGVPINTSGTQSGTHTINILSGSDSRITNNQFINNSVEAIDADSQLRLNITGNTFSNNAQAISYLNTYGTAMGAHIAENYYYNNSNADQVPSGATMALWGNYSTLNNFFSLGSSTPWRSLSVEGKSDLGVNALAGYFTSTSSVTSSFAGSIKALSFLSPIGSPLLLGNGTNTILRPDSSGGVIQLQNFAGSVNTYLLDNGNIGVGTSTPYAKLSIEGLSSLGNSATAGYFFATSTTATSTFSGGVNITTGTTTGQCLSFNGKCVGPAWLDPTYGGAAIVATNQSAASSTLVYTQVTNSYPGMSDQGCFVVGGVSGSGGVNVTMYLLGPEVSSDTINNAPVLASSTAAMGSSNTPQCLSWNNGPVLLNTGVYYLGLVFNNSATESGFYMRESNQTQVPTSSYNLSGTIKMYFTDNFTIATTSSVSGSAIPGVKIHMLNRF